MTHFIDVIDRRQAKFSISVKTFFHTPTEVPFLYPFETGVRSAWMFYISNSVSRNPPVSINQKFSKSKSALNAARDNYGFRSRELKYQLARNA